MQSSFPSNEAEKMPSPYTHISAVRSMSWESDTAQVHSPKRSREEPKEEKVLTLPMVTELPK
jgi:hypothetical protein